MFESGVTWIEWKCMPRWRCTGCRFCSGFAMMLLMVQKSGVHQLRLVHYAILLQGLGYIQTVVGNGISEPSTVACPSFLFWDHLYRWNNDGKIRKIHPLEFLVMLRTTPENFPGARNLFLKRDPNRKKHGNNHLHLFFPSNFWRFKMVIFYGGPGASLENMNLPTQESVANQTKPPTPNQDAAKGRPPFSVTSAGGLIFVVCVLKNMDGYLYLQ